MKTTIFISLLMSSALFLRAQQTYVPDDAFEYYLETHSSTGNTVSMGDASSMGDGVMNDSVPTAKIQDVTLLDVHSQHIADLTGIEDFSSLQVLKCYDNQLTSLDVTNNTSLTQLFCYSNSLSTLDLSQNTDLQVLSCGFNQLTDLDLTNNIHWSPYMLIIINLRI